MSEDEEARDYVRRLYQHVEDWYTSADNKAQVLLSLNGFLLTILGSSAFLSGKDVDHVVGKFGFESFLFFGLFIVCLGASITCALLCLKSRLHPDLDQLANTAAPRNMWFFQAISTVEAQAFVEALHKIDPAREIDILALNVQTFAHNVVRKHRWFNYGLKFFVSGLICFAVFFTGFLLRIFFGDLPVYSREMLLGGTAIILAFEALYWWLDYAVSRRVEAYHHSVLEQTGGID